MSSRYIHNSAPRSLAEFAVYRVCDEKELLNIVLRDVGKAAENEAARAQMAALSIGTIRWLITIDEIIKSRYRGKFRKMRAIAKNALRVAVYQLVFAPETPQSAVINHATGGVKRRLSSNEAGIVNAVLRNLAREIPSSSSELSVQQRIASLVNNPSLSVQYSHPQWLVDKWLATFGQEVTVSLLAANQTQPHFGVRPNPLVAKPSDVLATLSAAGVSHRPSVCRDIVLVDRVSDILDSELFVEGALSIQDPGAGLVVQLLQPEEGSTVIDVCSAPGGKSIAAAQYMNNTGNISAWDVSEGRLQRVREAAARLHATCIQTEVHDGTTPLQTSADVVLLDAPCSGTGTISRKPDVKYSKSADTLVDLVALQRNLLHQASQWVKPGGVLLYSTCSIEPEENTENVAWFLSTHQEFELVDPAGRIPNDTIKGSCLQTIPGIHDCDGAFAARMQKKL